jgi:hypothetical protein
VMVIGMVIGMVMVMGIGWDGMDEDGSGKYADAASQNGLQIQSRLQIQGHQFSQVK